MIIQLQNEISENNLAAISKKLSEIKFVPTEVKTNDARYLICIGKNEFDIRNIGSLPGVKDVHRVSDSYKLVSKKWKVEDTYKLSPLNSNLILTR